MKPELQSCLTWLATEVAESCLNRVNPIKLEKDIRAAWGIFCNSVMGSDCIDWDSLTPEEASELRFRKWGESDLYLIPVWLYPMIPDDLELPSIVGNKAHKWDIDLDRRFGVLNWGLILKEEAKNDACT